MGGGRRGGSRVESRRRYNLMEESYRLLRGTSWRRMQISMASCVGLPFPQHGHLLAPYFPAFLFVSRNAKAGTPFRLFFPPIGLRSRRLLRTADRRKRRLRGDRSGAGGWKRRRKKTSYCHEQYKARKFSHTL